jgi:hypothetical protein
MCLWALNIVWSAKKKTFRLFLKCHHPNPCYAGTDVTILKIFSPKKIAKNRRFLTQNKAKLCKMLIITLVFEKKRQFFSPKNGKNRRKV